MYQLYDAQNAMMAPLRAFSRIAGATLPHFGYGSESLRGGYELWARAGRQNANGSSTLASTTISAIIVPIADPRERSGISLPNPGRASRP